MPLLDLLPKAKDEIIAAKKDWLLARDMGKFRQWVGGTVYSLLKYFAYLLGHAAGLSKPASEIAPKTWALLNDNAWLVPWIETLDQTLSSMLDTFEQWKSIDAFEPSKHLARGLFADCGIKISDLNGSLYVSVGHGKLPVV